MGVADERDHLVVPVAINLEITDQDQLVIENTLNRRANAPSTQTGLASLRTRVEHVCKKPMQVAEGDKLFSVRLPRVGAA